MTGATANDTLIRDLVAADLREVARIDALHTGETELGYWRRVFRQFLAGDGAKTVGLCADRDSGAGLAGYLLGEVRAFEFGSEPCGWIFAVGVDPGLARQGVAKSLLAAALGRFRRARVETVRTMVRRTDVPVLSFFRSGGFVGGPFAQLEVDLAVAPQPNDSPRGQKP